MSKQGHVKRREIEKQERENINKCGKKCDKIRKLKIT